MTSIIGKNDLVEELVKSQKNYTIVKSLIDSLTVARDVAAAKPEPNPEPNQSQAQSQTQSPTRAQPITDAETTRIFNTIRGDDNDSSQVRFTLFLKFASNNLRTFTSKDAG